MKTRSLKSDLHESDLLDNEQLLMVHQIRKNIKNAVHSTYKSPQSRAIGWLYQNEHVPGELTLAECCHVLDFPIELVRIRMQYELYYHQICWSDLQSELPKVIVDELEFYIGSSTIDIAKRIWQNPGINIHLINEHAITVIELIKQNLVMVNATQNLWFTCRNPIEYKNLNWAKCWSFYD